MSAATASPTHLFRHGAASSQAMWARQLAALNSDLAVLAIDLPEHGVRRAQPFTFEAAADAIGEALAAARAARALLIGLSLGGYVAMDYATRAPQRAAGLILSGCAIDYSAGSIRCSCG